MKLHIIKNFVRLSCHWPLMARVVAALFGGYLLTLTSSMLLSQILNVTGMDRVNASLTAMLVSFTIYTVIVVWFFATASVKKVWINLLVGLVITGSLVWLIRFWNLS